MIDYFSSLELSPSAVADWDVRNVEWRLTTWDLDRPAIDRPNLGRDEGFGLGF
jgi:hypothetical protein